MTEKPIFPPDYTTGKIVYQYKPQNKFHYKLNLTKSKPVSGIVVK